MKKSNNSLDGMSLLAHCTQDRSAHGRRDGLKSYLAESRRVYNALVFKHGGEHPATVEARRVVDVTMKRLGIGDNE